MTAVRSERASRDEIHALALVLRQLRKEEHCMIPFVFSPKFHKARLLKKGPFLWLHLALRLDLM